MPRKEQIGRGNKLVQRSYLGNKGLVNWRKSKALTWLKGVSGRRTGSRAGQDTQDKTLLP